MASVTPILTDAERRVLRALERATVQHKNPSMAEIQEFTNPKMAVSTVRAALVRLAGKGYVELAVRRARGVKQLQPSPAKSRG